MVGIYCFYATRGWEVLFAFLLGMLGGGGYIDSGSEGGGFAGRLWAGLGGGGSRGGWGDMNEVEVTFGTTLNETTRCIFCTITYIDRYTYGTDIMDREIMERGNRNTE